LAGFSGRSWCVGDQFREFREVLSGCCEEELISGAIGSAEAQPVEPEYALEVSEEHLDLLAPSTRLDIGVRGGDAAGSIACDFMDDVRRKAGFVEDDDTPVASPADLEAYDAIIFGTPTLFGNMAGQMKLFLDQAGGLWARNALVGKVAAVFTSTGSQHGGHEATLLTTQIPLQHFGMLIAGLPYAFAGQTTADGIVGGAPYGAGTIAGPDGSRSPSEIDLAGARFQGAHVAKIASRLAGVDLRRAAA
jgi:NAD(P)H dehydrogenase (quinone)